MAALGGGNDNDCENQGTEKAMVADRDSTELCQEALCFSQMWGTEFEGDHQNTISFGGLGRTERIHFMMAISLYR